MLRMLVDVQLEKEILLFRARLEELKPIVNRQKAEFMAITKRFAC